jgi:hypothetical protein
MNTAAITAADTAVIVIYRFVRDDDDILLEPETARELRNLK